MEYSERDHMDRYLGGLGKLKYILELSTPLSE